jgi:hypothetical protein
MTRFALFKFPVFSNSNSMNLTTLRTLSKLPIDAFFSKFIQRPEPGIVRRAPGAIWYVLSFLVSSAFLALENKIMFEMESQSN